MHAIVAVDEAEETSKIPNTLFALLINKTLNCSTNSIFFIPVVDKDFAGIL